MNNEEKILLMLAELKSELTFVKNTALLMEQDYGTKLSAISDELDSMHGQLDDHTAALTRIETKLDAHESRIGVHELQLDRLKAK